MSCLICIYLSKEVQYISVDQSKLNVHGKICFLSDPNFYIFVTKFKGLGISMYSDQIFDLRGLQQ